MSNRLAHETSPYLKQHQDNPVDWYPWGDEALARARSEDKPILLSIGYSACHWCHVMAHESFESHEIAELMNQNFINIKVDREERPDLDQIYQNVAQIFTRGGGWPLTVFLTPDLKPFFGGTYFPPEDRYGRPGFPRVLTSLVDAYRNQRADVLENASKVTESIAAMETLGARATDQALPNRASLVEAMEKLLGEIDWRNGGMGSAPKFPNTMVLSFLWRMGAQLDHEEAREAALLSLEKMASGGIYDQLGGGFSRYSVDESWSVPHFEKMLYDNGLLMKAYAEVLLLSDARPGWLSSERKALFTQTLMQTVDYLEREMTSPEGLFYAAQDADSEGEEGKFFVWNPEELSAILSAEELKVFNEYFGVTESGNFEHGNTVLYRAKPIQETLSPQDQAFLEQAKQKVFAVRERRVRPGLDDKILVSWNGLAISGLIWTAQALKSTKARDMAVRAYRETRLRAGAGGSRLFSTIQKGKPRFNAYLDDYAFLAMAALDLSRFTGDREFIQDAKGWVDEILLRFSDSNEPGFWFTSSDHETLIQRPKTLFDQAIPAGTSVSLTAILVLRELGEIPGHELERHLERIFPMVSKSPYGFGEALCLSLMYLSGPVTVSGPETRSQVIHPHIWAKPSAESQLIVCHRQTCTQSGALNKALTDLI